MTKYLKNSSKSFGTSITTTANSNSNTYSDVKKFNNNNNNHSNSNSNNNKNKCNNNYKSIYSDNNNTSDNNSNHYSNNNNGVCGSGGGSRGGAVNNKFEYQLSFYGWKKKCLFVLLFMLILLIIINLILTLWILNVMEFSWDGIMGQLKIISGGGIQLSGQTLVLDLLRASIIRSKHGQQITIESSKNFTIQTLDQYNNIENLMYLDNKNLEFLIRRNFRIQDQHGQQIFGIDHNEIMIGSNQLKIESDGGALVNDSVHVMVLRAEAGKKLVLESRLKKLDVKGFQEIFIQSKAGYIDGRILKDVKLHTIAGNIRFDSPNIFMPNLKISQSTNKMSSLSSSSSSSSSQLLSSSLLSSSIGSIFGHHLTSGAGSTSSQSSTAISTAATTNHNSNNNNNNNNNNKNNNNYYDKFYHKVYQLCSCASGKLFLTSSHTLCSVDDSNVCR